MFEPVWTRTHLKWIRRADPFLVHGSEVDRLRRDLEAIGFRCVRLDGADFRSEADLILGLGRALGFLEGHGANWDAAVECLGDVSGKIALCWHAPEALLAWDLHAFVSGMHNLLACARDFLRGGRGDRVEAQLEVFLVSDRDDFRN